MTFYQHDKGTCQGCKCFFVINNKNVPDAWLQHSHIRPLASLSVFQKLHTILMLPLKYLPGSVCRWFFHLLNKFPFRDLAGKAPANLNTTWPDSGWHHPSSVAVVRGWSMHGALNRTVIQLPHKRHLLYGGTARIAWWRNINPASIHPCGGYEWDLWELPFYQPCRPTA